MKLPTPNSLKSAMTACAALLVLGCSALPASQQEGADARGGAPWLALSPAALGCAAAVQQRLSVTPPGESPRELDALLEVDTTALRLALLNMGQMVGTLSWDGAHLEPQLSRWWPAQLKPEQVLSDLQLAFWPEDAIAKALPAPWTLMAAASGERVLLHNGTPHVRVRSVSPDALEIVYERGGWTLRVDTPGGSQLCTRERSAS